MTKTLNGKYYFPFSKGFFCGHTTFIQLDQDKLRLNE